MTTTVVIGAGIVGLAAAMQLLLDGNDVTVVDPDEPASGCSSGNAGYLSQANVFPPSSTESLFQIVRMLRDPDGPLVVRPRYLHRFLPWGIEAALATKPARLRSVTDALAALILPAIDAYGPLLRAAGANDLLSRRGALVVCRTDASLRARSSRLSTLREYGVAVEEVDARTVADMEPAVARDIVGAIHYPNSAHCLDPRELGSSFARHIARNGGSLVRARVRRLEQKPDDTWTLTTDDGVLSASKVVVSAGVWSKELLRPLGYRVPMEAERGYHLMLPEPRVGLNRPVSLADAYVVATPMSEGLRLAGTAEFAGADAPMDPRRARMMSRLAAPFLPGLSEAGARPWMGRRPSLVDGLPAIGRSEAYANLFFCFGHNHNGLMQAAVSGRLLADLVGGRRPSVDPRPYRLERFSPRLSWRRAA